MKDNMIKSLEEMQFIKAKNPKRNQVQCKQ